MQGTNSYEDLKLITQISLSDIYDFAFSFD